MTYPAGTPELWRTSLCRHNHSRADCCYAHCLRELRPPDESRMTYANQWNLGHVDRFYGQVITQQQRERIQSYYDKTPACDRPLWAIGLCLLETRKEHCLGFAYPWDFGLVRDYDDLMDRRYERTCPFKHYPDIWKRLDRRRRIMLGYAMPRHILGVVPPSSMDVSTQTLDLARVPPGFDCHYAEDVTESDATESVVPMTRLVVSEGTAAGSSSMRWLGMSSADVAGSSSIAADPLPDLS